MGLTRNGSFLRFSSLQLPAPEIVQGTKSLKVVETLRYEVEVVEYAVSLHIRVYIYHHLLYDHLTMYTTQMRIHWALVRSFFDL